MSEELLLLVDGNNVTIRAHSGMVKAGLTSSDGTLTGGLYGCIRTFNSYVQRLNPSHVIVFWDNGRSTFRKEIYADYKGDRPTRSEEESSELSATFRLFKEYLDIIGLSHMSCEGVEADDLIAKAVLDHQDQVPITILSADHDLRQLVRQPNPYPVTVMKPSMSKTAKEATYTYQSVIDEYKLPPHRLAELWAIEGDTSDNIKGVPGFGPVKALKALQEHGSLNDAVANHPKFAGHEKRIFDNFRMIKLPNEITANFNVPDLYSSQFPPVYLDEDALRRFFTKYDLHSLTKKMEEGLLFKQEEGMKTGLHHL